MNSIRKLRLPLTVYALLRRVKNVECEFSNFQYIYCREVDKNIDSFLSTLARYECINISASSSECTFRQYTC